MISHRATMASSGVRTTCVSPCFGNATASRTAPTPPTRKTAPPSHVRKTSSPVGGQTERPPSASTSRSFVTGQTIVRMVLMRGPSVPTHCAALWVANTTAEGHWRAVFALAPRARKWRRTASPAWIRTSARSGDIATRSGHLTQHFLNCSM